MCGIAGIIGSIAGTAHVERMVAALMHRGPDDHGVWEDPARGAVLGHTRLSIIDLSAAGHQPMTDVTGRYWIVFNGEIYNYQELRVELETLGQCFRSHSDTEVILGAYAVWGRDCVARLRGMFAFVIWDTAERRLFLARDRLGIKPLYFVRPRGSLLFASEIKALLATGLVAREADLQSIWDYLSLGSVLQPQTILRGVEMLAPAHWMEVDQQGTRSGRYWCLDAATAALREQLSGISYAEAVAETRRHVEDAARHHVIADVPVGAFLSGGVDSTVIVGVLGQVLGRRIETFTVGFPAEHDHLNELPFARRAAESLNADHHEVILDDNAIAEGFDALLTALDQPSVDGTNSYFVSRATCQKVKVALSGIGGDELFGGYPHFQGLIACNRRFPFAVPGARWLAEGPGRRWHPRLKLPLRVRGLPPARRTETLRLLLGEAEKWEALHPDLITSLQPEPLARYYNRLHMPDGDDFRRLSYTELHGYMLNTILRDVDAVSMAHALEVRPVFLDHRLVEFVYGLPSCWKQDAYAKKRLLIDAFPEFLPLEVMNRPKQGFEFPLVAWLRGPLQERALEAFNSAIARQLFSPRFLRLKVEQVQGSVKADNQLWAQFILIEYLHRYEITLSNECRGWHLV